MLVNVICAAISAAVVMGAFCLGRIYEREKQEAYKPKHINVKLTDEEQAVLNGIADRVMEMHGE